MIITIVSDVLGEENNGTTVTAKRLIENLKNRGHIVKVISPLLKNEKNYYSLKRRNFWIFNDYVAKNGVVLAKIDREIIKEGIKGSDIVHIILPFQVGREAAKIAEELGIPTTTACHCQAENVTSHFKIQKFKMPNKAVYKFLYNRFFKDQKYIHCPTEFIANELRKHGYNQEMHIISNGVSQEYYHHEVKKPIEYQNKICILSVGRFSREKRHDLLIKAIKKSKHEKDIQLILAGTGPLEKKYHTLAKKLTNPISIGVYKSNELSDIINYCDFYVHPADFELEGIALLEAMTCGLVPIVSDSKKSATRFMALHDMNIFKANNYLDLSKKIDYFIENPNEVLKVKEEYIEYSKQFQMDQCIDKMIEMFNKAINTYKQG